MSEDLDWTERLGEAFLVDEERVLDAIQHLRQRAYDSGKLEDLEHLSVSREADRQIIIEPVVREVVYVPYYDTRVVYGPWWWADHPPLHWRHRHHHHHHWVHWSPGIHISWNFYFSAFRWDHRHIVVIDRDYHHHRHHWRARQIARHRHARHWRHDPYHRRGVQYRNPRTRDYFEKRHRERRDGGRNHFTAGPAERLRNPDAGALRQRLKDSGDVRRVQPGRQSETRRVTESLRKNRSSVNRVSGGRAARQDLKRQSVESPRKIKRVESRATERQRVPAKVRQREGTRVRQAAKPAQRMRSDRLEASQRRSLLKSNRSRNNR